MDVWKSFLSHEAWWLSLFMRPAAPKSLKCLNHYDDELVYGSFSLLSKAHFTLLNFLKKCLVNFMGHRVAEIFLHPFLHFQPGSKSQPFSWMVPSLPILGEEFPVSQSLRLSASFWSLKSFCFWNSSTISCWGPSFSFHSSMNLW